jgi:NADPH-dependent 2,4-dienoyl-CoA reductase/sulfur reductase-like enzyme/rhodanese-related sulfurtransferase
MKEKTNEGEKVKILIIGGVAAGTKVAAKLKRENFNCDVTLLTKSKDISYAGCGLPYYVGKVISDRSQLIVNTPDSFSKLTGVHVITETEATKVNPKEKTVTARDLKTNEVRTYRYDKLVIATGAKAWVPPVEGVGLANVFFLRTPDDAASIRAFVESGEIKRVVVVGGGYNGLEIAENLSALGIRVSVIDMAEHIPPGFDKDFAEAIENRLAEQGIVAFTGTRLEAILGEEKAEKVKTDKRIMKTDAVILCVGIRANTEFLDGSGIELMPDKTVKVNEFLQTNFEDIYAVGDCASVLNKITKKPVWSPMGSTANIAGRIAAKNMIGNKIPYQGVLGTAVIKLPGFNAGRTGLTEEQAKKAGFDAVSVVAVTDDKAHYYPDSSVFIVKMTADRSTKRLLGLQVLGKGAIDKMTDIAATAITLGATPEDIENMDLAYAPPFSTAIHPFSHTVNILLNKINGALETVTPTEFALGKAQGYKIIDASRKPSIDGAIYVDLGTVNGEIPGLSKDERLLLVCTKGKRAYMLQRRLKNFGYKHTLVLEGGTTFNEVIV